MKPKLLLLAGVSALALATSIQADITINFQALPSGHTFPAGTLTPTTGSMWTLFMARTKPLRPGCNLIPVR